MFIPAGRDAPALWQARGSPPRGNRLPGRFKIDSLKIHCCSKVRAIMAMADIRRDYSLGGLNRADLDTNPLAQFNQWFVSASAGGRWRKIGIALFKLWHAILGHSPADV